jgi:hypothetical protein
MACTESIIAVDIGPSRQLARKRSITVFFSRIESQVLEYEDFGILQRLDL